jgi:imidazolonepropionase-like amidohydrolase
MRTEGTGPLTLFEGARLLTGDGATAIEDGAFLVDGPRITWVGRREEAEAPAGAAHIDLTGKTVVPAFVDAHSHIGYMNDLALGPQNYTRENILDHMQRFAYFGVAASQAMGSDFDDLPYAIRDETLAGQHPDAARFLTAGQGLASLAEISASNMRHAAHVVTTEEGARAAVRELASKNVTLVKTWVDSRGGSIEPLAPNLYRAIIDEAHALNMRVAAHATGLEEAKGLLRAGLDVFAHMISDVDDELVTLFEAHPDTTVLLALGGLRRQIDAPWLDPPHPLVAETVSAAQISRLMTRLASTAPEALERGRQSWDRIASGIRRLRDAGVTIGVGTDGGGQTGDQFVGWTLHTELENMVAAGMTPAEVLVAATKNSAGILGLDELGQIAPGKSADFVVLDANPLDDITNTRRIDRVYLRGHEVDRASLRGRWSAGGTSN